MTREILINAFAMNTPGHLSPGLWRHTADRSADYRHIRHWVDLAKTLERGLIDGLFIADVVGVYDVYGGSVDAAVRGGVQVPVNDPLQLVPAMAYATEHLGFGVTASVSFEHPFPFARRMSTLDHLTGGRVGWNIVTSYLDSGARNLGQARQAGHDDRYDVADEYLEVVYKLWEGSWADDAVLRDRASGIFADPAKVRPIRHDGPNFKVPGIHLCEPSPQRTPVLYQAGASSRGRRFAARHAECVFVGGPTILILKRIVSDLRAAAVEAARRPDDIKILNMQTVILGRTDSEAEDKAADYRSLVDHTGALALLSGWTGVDLSTYGLDEPLRHVKTEAGQSALESFTTADPDRQWTIRELAQWCGIGGRGPVLVGSARTVADQLQHWIAETDVDGFNLAWAVNPGTFEDIVDLLVPELQRRGAYKTAYRPGTLREKLFGDGPRLNARHTGAGFRTLP